MELTTNFLLKLVEACPVNWLGLHNGKHAWGGTSLHVHYDQVKDTFCKPNCKVIPLLICISLSQLALQINVPFAVDVKDNSTCISRTFSLREKNSSFFYLIFV